MIGRLYNGDIDGLFTKKSYYLLLNVTSDVANEPLSFKSLDIDCKSEIIDKWVVDFKIYNRI